jgi:signal transduction histidine kinase
MIVDDEPGMRMGVQRALRDYRFYLPDTDCDVGFEIIEAESGERALELIHDTPPAILLLDHKLPGMTGMDVLERLPKGEEDILTIMITAYASIEIAVKATKEGAYDFLPKPFTPAELKYSVKKAASRVVLARRARDLAEEKRRVRFEFIRVLGHELKAPLAAVDSYLDLLQDRTLGETVGKYDDMIGRSRTRIDQMRTLIIDLLDMTKIESGTRVREIEPVDLVDVATSSIELMESRAAERHIDLNLHVDGPVVIDADRTEMDIIFNNLISNAVKYNRDDGTVDVTIKATGDGGARLSVADTGIGMTKDDQAKLFGEFARIRNRHTKHILGSGLGLSIVKRLVTIYGGDIRVNSTPDVGSTFSASLRPAEPEDAPAEQADDADGDAE